MSEIHVLRTVDALLKDPALGLAAQTKIAAANSGSPVIVRTDFEFPDWNVSENLKPARQPQVTVSLTSGRKNLVAVNPTRDAVWGIDIGYECFDADKKTVKASVAIVAAALTVCIDSLVSFSQLLSTIPSSIVLVSDPLVFAYGTYPGKGRGGSPVTSGFICSVTLLERSRNGS